jgi:hypothetical protein
MVQKMVDETVGLMAQLMASQLAVQMDLMMAWTWVEMTA